MNVTITTFTSPFSFFCANENGNDYHRINLISEQCNLDKLSKCNLEDLQHGRYVAVMWRNKWTRGIVSLESKCLIWLVDYGKFVIPTKYMIFKELSLEHRKLPTSIFEASIHGVVPVDKVSELSDACNSKNKVTSVWTQNSIQKSQEIIKNASRKYFQPIALLSSPHNDVVLGNLFVEIPGKGYVNIIDELENEPAFFEENNEAYIKNLLMSYKSRRRHRACLLKPDIPGFSLPNIDIKINLEDYLSIVAKSPTIEDTLLNKIEMLPEVGSTVTDLVPIKDRNSLNLTPSEIQEYSNKYINFNGREYNMLTVLINKARDLKICRYKDHDLKSVGRGSSYKTFKTSHK